jgi:predicted regulator of Ras-like GTPase activity (Roadblock/LC7/MglB family)
MFKTLLSKVSEQAGSVLGLALVSLDGIAIEKIHQDAALNLDTVIAEFTDRMKKTIQATGEMGTGPARELVAFTDQAVIILRSVHEDYYILCAVPPDGNYGRTRHALRMIIPEIAQELA